MSKSCIRLATCSVTTRRLASARSLSTDLASWVARGTTSRGQPAHYTLSWATPPQPLAFQAPLGSALPSPPWRSGSRWPSHTAAASWSVSGGGSGTPHASQHGSWPEYPHTDASWHIDTDRKTSALRGLLPPARWPKYHAARGAPAAVAEVSGQLGCAKPSAYSPPFFCLFLPCRLASLASSYSRVLG